MSINNLITMEQFGFKTGHSTELAAIQLVDHLTKQMDMGEVPTNIYIDLSKAFDTLDSFYFTGQVKLLWNVWVGKYIIS